MIRLVVALWVAGVVPATAGGARVEAFYSPQTDLETVEIATLKSGLGHNVNFAAFVLSDFKVIRALQRLAAAGSNVRVYLDPHELERLHLHSGHPLVQLARTPNAQVKIKSPKGRLMHLKGYSIGGFMVRTGSANDSRDGLTAQDNDLVLIYDRAAAAKFDVKFEEMWSRPDNGSLPLN